MDISVLFQEESLNLLGRPVNDDQNHWWPNSLFLSLNFNGGVHIASLKNIWDFIFYLQFICVCDAWSDDGSEEPCAVMSLSSIGKLGVEENKKLAEIFFELIKDDLNIDGTR